MDGPRNPREIITRVIVFVLLGAIANVAVAWGISQSVKPMLYTQDRVPRFGLYQCSQTKTWWRLTYLSVPGFANIHSTEHSATPPGEHDRWFRIDELPTWSRFRESRLGSSTGSSYLPMWREYAWGWPVLAMRFRQEADTARQSQQVFDAIGMPFRTPIPMTPRSSKEFLPIGLIWPGFAINTLFYAATLWSLFAALGVVRRWRRIKRGLCAKCAYDLRGSNASACPECGTRVSRQPAAAPSTLRQGPL
jgi:hypothetical protein